MICMYIYIGGYDMYVYMWGVPGASCSSNATVDAAGYATVASATVAAAGYATAVHATADAAGYDCSIYSTVASSVATTCACTCCWPYAYLVTRSTNPADIYI